MQSPILTGDTESQVANIVGIQCREAGSGRHPEGRRKAISGEARLEEERPIVIGLKGIAGANLVEDEEATITSSHNEGAGWERTVRKPYARREIGLVDIRQMLGVARGSSGNDCSGRVIEIALPVMGLVEGCGVIVT